MLSLPVPDKYFISVLCANANEVQKLNAIRKSKLLDRLEDVISFKYLSNYQFDVLNEVIKYAAFLSCSPPLGKSKSWSVGVSASGKRRT